MFAPGFLFLSRNKNHHLVQLSRNTSTATNNQNDSIVLNKQSVERGLGCSLSYHTTRFDIHHPYRLFLGHPDIPGGLGVVLPGHTVHPGRPLLAAHIPPASNGEPAREGEQDPLLRCAKADDSGIVHKVVITSGNQGIF